MSGRYACQTPSVRVSSRTHTDSIGAIAESNSTSATPVAFADVTAKLAPRPSHVAPSGYGRPGHTRMPRIVRCGLMRVSDFDFDLPSDRVAQTPCPRGESRLLVVDRRVGGWREAAIADLPRLLDPGD